MGELENIRKNTEFYIGTSEHPTRLLEEILDNSLDEIQAGYAKNLTIKINTINKEFSIYDDGRGIPFDGRLSEEKDPPILICTNLFTSGKFEKNNKNSSYFISSGKHGVGLTAVNALSDYLKIEIWRNGKKGIYDFVNAIDIKRTYEKCEKTINGTQITCKPSEKYFHNLDIDLKVLEEKLRIALVNYPESVINLEIDEKKYLIKGDEKSLILKHLTKNELKWFSFENKNKKNESYYVKFGWDNEKPILPKFIGSVNLIPVNIGKHIDLFSDIIKNVFIKLGKKFNYEFEENDCLVFLRSYINIKIINTSFSEQIKTKLASKSDLSIMEKLSDDIFNYFIKNEEDRNELLIKFKNYHQFRKNKEIDIPTISNDKNKVSKKFNKLIDCSNSGKGTELIIGEGDSAIGGLKHIRDLDNQAILPLKGVTVNVLTKNDYMKNPVVLDIVKSCKCGIFNECDITKLGYERIIIATDADPAGYHIRSLLKLFFAYLMPEVIKNGNLWVCETPLYTTRRDKELICLWTEDEINKARIDGYKLERNKGLGSYLLKDLKYLILDKNTRRIVRVNWSDNIKEIFNLMANSADKKKLALNEWENNKNDEENE